MLSASSEKLYCGAAGVEGKWIYTSEVLESSGVMAGLDVEIAKRPPFQTARL